ncbi:unnamed protein product [Linum trigynum]|uniref:C2H2-type domain-containing protein n=1 Tax=Linum trigynum TaxID=586398 RepID=A0AAV2EBQ7_9ROSI
MNNGRLVAPHRRHDSFSPLSTWVCHHNHDEERSRSLYVCSFCRRDFSSAQALGGHMNVHRRDRATLLLSSSNHKLPSPPPPPPPSSSSPSLTLTNHHRYQKPAPATVSSPSDQLLGSPPRKPIFVFPFSNNGAKPTPAEKGGDGEEMVSLELGIGWKQEAAAAAAIALPALDLELRLRCST